MASIFTYDPDPPRVYSPWFRGAVNAVGDSENGNGTLDQLSNSDNDPIISLHEAAKGQQPVTRLQAEPQEGPVEYKLHLLLRARRKFRSTSTSSNISGSRHSKLDSTQPRQGRSESPFEPSLPSDPGTPPATSTQQTRHHRLEQLTTQLLWRLQQSSPHHTSSATNIILPSLPEALPELQAPQKPDKLLHGLEESHGALYEIGVSDDGTLIGLAEDEMQESLNNLRAMAACLGCTVDILRKANVGECEWLEDILFVGGERKVCRSGKLLVVEALIKPHLPSKSSTTQVKDAHETSNTVSRFAGTVRPAVSTEQLRITFTGPTMSGKSTLLGTLTTSTLDNGRGKSRLSMLRHRHEISSGVTSSVTQELIGYQEADNGAVGVVNYAAENIASWIDVHVATAGSRLVFISDSAGHPRYRRTTVRGLVGCAPHWTLLCVPADGIEQTSDQAGSTRTSQQTLGFAVSDMDLSGAQLDLCLRLCLPLVIVITKLDLASKTGLKASLTKVLDALKAAGRRPAMLSNIPGDVYERDLQSIEPSLIDGAYNVALPLLNDAVESVPIVLTSSVQGTGISNLHALLHELPIPDRSPESAHNDNLVFHIEDVYRWPAEMEGVVVSGRLRSGQISVGDSGTLGPFSTHDLEDSEDSDEPTARKLSSHLPASRSFPGALREPHLAPPYFQLPNQEWRRYKVTSVRNLRLPVHSLLADQIGTVAIVPDESKTKRNPTAGFARIRKGMVLTSVQPMATRSFVAEFRREDLESLAVGNHVVVYISSIRASARVVSARAPDSPVAPREDVRTESNGHDPFELDDTELSEAGVGTDGQNEKIAGAITAQNLLVTFSFDATKEFVVIGDQVLVMPGGGPGLYGGQERGEKGVAGLEGFVGNVTEIFG